MDCRKLLANIFEHLKELSFEDGDIIKMSSSITSSYNRYYLDYISLQKEKKIHACVVDGRKKICEFDGKLLEWKDHKDLYQFCLENNDNNQSYFLI